ncbi:hypothetical protein Micbo1qcDRAFT_217793 [Microdochium bolleyi]|uniref:Uncharacterized protein n=1 Tax=Microdochium bolleyi TaxID=196109 RepID=A0A136JFY9_9PEZI|nr:hypothetical protein Micbo1qcDRAFT_217793 [Microdochium bolleyi]
MNSKSHIFHHWNLELFKEVNPRIRTALQNFQAFWEEHDLAGRIRARMIKRNQIPRIAADTAAHEAEARVFENSTTDVNPRHSRSGPKKSQRNLHPDVDTPIEDNFSDFSLPLSHSLPVNFKYDPDTIPDSFEAFPSEQYPSLEGSPAHPATPQPSILHWRGPSSFQTQQDSAGNASAYYPALGDTNGVSPYPDLDMARSSRHVEGKSRLLYEANDSEVEPKYEPSERGCSVHSEEAADIVEQVKQDEFKPKGQQFNGMGGFDAASNVQKRKRNQRKNPEVLVQLRANSESVTTDEHVFDSHFNLQRVRDVFDESDISCTCPVNSSTENSPSTSRAHSIQGTIDPDRKPITAQATANQASSEIPRRPSNLSSSGINSLGGRLGGHSMRSIGGQITGYPASGMWHPLRAANNNATFKMATTSANGPYQSLLHFGKENDPGEFFGQDLSTNANPYFASHDPRIPEAFNPLFVQHPEQDRRHLMPNFENIVQTGATIQPYDHRHAPFPLMHLPPPHDGLSRHHHDSVSDVQL